MKTVKLNKSVYVNSIHLQIPIPKSVFISQSNHLHYNTLPHFVSTTHTRNKRSIPSYAHFIYLSPVVGITKINPKNSTLFAICNLQSITTREKTTRRPKGGTIINKHFCIALEKWRSGEETKSPSHMMIMIQN